MTAVGEHLLLAVDRAAQSDRGRATVPIPAHQHQLAPSKQVRQGVRVQLLHHDAIIDAFITTLSVAVLAALISTVFGTLAAIGFFSMKRRPRSICMSINNIPMTNAEIITGVSLMLLFVFSTQLLNGLVYLILLLKDFDLKFCKFA